MVADAVVDDLEAVEIQEQHGESCRGVALRPRDGVAEPLGEVGAVGQASELVVQRDVDERFLRVLPDHQLAAQVEFRAHGVCAVRQQRHVGRRPGAVQRGVGHAHHTRRTPVTTEERQHRDSMCRQSLHVAVVRLASVERMAFVHRDGLARSQGLLHQFVATWHHAPRARATRYTEAALHNGSPVFHHRHDGHRRANRSGEEPRHAVVRLFRGHAEQELDCATLGAEDDRWIRGLRGQRKRVVPDHDHSPEIPCRAPRSRRDS